MRPTLEERRPSAAEGKIRPYRRNARAGSRPEIVCSAAPNADEAGVTICTSALSRPTALTYYHRCYKPVSLSPHTKYSATVSPSPAHVVCDARGMRRSDRPLRPPPIAAGRGARRCVSAWPTVGPAATSLRRGPARGVHGGVAGGARRLLRVASRLLQGRDDGLGRADDRVHGD